MFRLYFFAAVLLFAASTSAQQSDACASPRDLHRVASERLLSDERLRAAVGARPRVVRVACEQRDKESQRSVALAYVVGYETGAAAEVTFSPADFRALDVRRMPGRPQSSEDERQEGRDIIMQRIRVAEGTALEGGFVVDPPPGSPPGRYLLFLLSRRARHVDIQEYVVDLTRGTYTGRRKIEAAR